jgi:type I restriction enzyme S subunit
MVPNGWKKTSIGAIAHVSSGATPDRRRPELWGGSIPWITTGKVNDGVIKIADEFITEEGLRSSSTRIYPQGTLIMAMYGQGQTRGRVALLGINAATNQACASIEPAENVSNTFLYQYLHANYNTIRQLSQGGNQANLSGELIKSFSIVLPPLPEQRAIANILATWDRAIEQTTRLIEAKRRLKQGLMQQLLTGKGRFVHFQNNPWQCRKLGDLLIQVERPVACEDDRRYRLISLRRRSGGVFHREPLLGKQIQTKNLYETREGDFLISKMQVVHGASGLVHAEFDRTTISGSYVVLVAKDPDQLDMGFFNYLSQTPFMYRHALISSHGVHIEKMSFSLPDFLKKAVRIPVSIEEQRKIAGVLSSASSEITVLENEIEMLKLQKQALMQKLLTGQVRVKIS